MLHAINHNSQKSYKISKTCCTWLCNRSSLSICMERLTCRNNDRGMQLLNLSYHTVHVGPWFEARRGPCWHAAHVFSPPFLLWEIFSHLLIPHTILESVRVKHTECKIQCWLIPSVLLQTTHSSIHNGCRQSNIKPCAVNSSYQRI